MTKILVDENIPGAAELLAPMGEIESFRGRELSAAQVGQAAALLVRSVTPVNARLLANTQVGFVGSTTIGVDHLDTHWLESQGIRWCNAPGSNARSVVDYCLSALCVLPGVLDGLLSGGRVGIIGYGNVGVRLHRQLEALGIACIAYDPFLDSRQCPILSSLEDVLTCNYVSLHTPLTHSGGFPTYHLLSVEQLKQLPQGAVLLNAGRGEVLSNDVLLTLMTSRPDIQLVLDVWENEPSIDLALMQKCRIATPHIAGYSQDGKWAGLMQVAQALSEFMGVGLAAVEAPLVPAPSLDLEGNEGFADVIRAVVLAAYDVRRDDRSMREALLGTHSAGNFDGLRRAYPARREISALRVKCSAPVCGQLGEALVALGISALLPE